MWFDYKTLQKISRSIFFGKENINIKSNLINYRLDIGVIKMII